MTLLFSDLVGSTMLSERVEPEQLRDLFAFYRAAAARRGEPVQREPDPVSPATASSPASGTPSRTRTTPGGPCSPVSTSWWRCATPGPSWTAASALAAEVRVGIHTGRVVVTDLSDDRASPSGTRSSGSSRTSPPGSSRRPSRAWS